MRQNKNTTGRSSTFSSIVNTKFGRARDRHIDGDVHASCPDCAKSIYSQDWHELEENRSMTKQQRSVEQVQELHSPSGEDISVDEFVV